ncbi:MAG TPA: RpiB/LacA/LacB family sugar-phosphate isomerase [Candidatus Saccharimonadales bacterium]|nr:RpiB/LacA/LacB family sugar-phosphate isomerase [Candidatus Saccharimonadales bacterium]
MKIALATDHAGYEQLKQLKEYLVAEGYECQDFGPASFDEADDYPDFIFPAARAVASGDCEAGIIMGGSGQGEAMAANRVKGARCTLFYGPVVAKAAIDAQGTVSEDPYEILRLSRRHNHANVLSLSARFLTFEEIKRAVSVWLEASYDIAERHTRRVGKLDT